jgi:hypothetical protein
MKTFQVLSVYLFVWMCSLVNEDKASSKYLMRSIY